MAAFVAFGHPVTNLVTDFTNPSNLTSLIFKKVNCDTLLLPIALKKSDRRINVITKSTKCPLFSIQGKRLTSLNPSGTYQREPGTHLLNYTSTTNYV